MSIDWSVIIVGILSLLGTLFGSIAGIMTANKLSIYRIEQLEKKVDAHNNLHNRVVILEEHDKAHEKEISDAFSKIRSIESKASFSS